MFYNGSEMVLQILSQTTICSQAQGGAFHGAATVGCWLIVGGS